MSYTRGTYNTKKERWVFKEYKPDTNETKETTFKSFPEIVKYINEEYKINCNFNHVQKIGSNKYKYGDKAKCPYSNIFKNFQIISKNN